MIAVRTGSSVAAEIELRKNSAAPLVEAALVIPATRSEPLGHQRHYQRTGQQPVAQQDHTVQADIVKSVAECAFESVNSGGEGNM